MAATVIDALLVTLGLDASQFRKGQQEVSDDLKKQREDAKNTAKEMAEQGKKAASFFSSIKTELLALTGVTVTAGGLISFVKSTTSGLMDLSIQSKALGLSARELDGWSKSAEAAGSSAEKISASLQGFQGAIQGARVGDYSSSIFGGLAQLNALTGQNFDVWGQDASSLAKTSLDALRKISDPNLRRQVGLSLGFDDATLQRNQEGKFLPDVDRLTKNSGISDESINGAKEFNSAWAELNQNLDTTKNQFYTFLIPYVREFNGVLLQLSNWMKSHPDEMRQKVESFFGAIESGAKVADNAARSVGGWENAIKLLIGLKVATWVMGITKAFTGLFALTPPAWFVAASAVGVGAYQNISNAATKADHTDSLWESIKQRWSAGGWYNNQQNIQAVSPEQRKKDQDERSFWESTKNLLSQAVNALISPAGAASMQPNIVGGYQPNVPLNAQAARLGAKGRAFLQAMAGEFGALEGKYGLPAGLLSSVAGTESGGDPFAVSPKGAKGPFQFMDGTARDLGLKGMDVYDPHKSADAAARYLRYLLDATGGDLEKALASYNWGLGNVQKKGMDNLPSETRNYVPKVMAGMRPGAGMAVDRSMPGQSGATYQFYGTKITTQAQNVEQLTSDIKKHGDNRVMLLAGYSGQ
ncbi:TPA: lytic transglycosylase domain-containing protein [Klebsiella pneumoniae subsp. pneumoniae]|jgi:soluble lytic murein transglycosylase-like protein|uniref:lytic transglycosylase domain-containing protein n=1 Tax=Klebsiella pneumoniae TaxID=573 RepID=UPI00200CDFA7|nr:lytic transglycosylase domain-containing protein [Klebsiella pneumoniae]HEO9558927.1 lytic transglycosylase domain-containing protein [Klebsiella pneumoniae subsp. pneumoniae]EJZ8831551.1 lytic transglycosylase domain-containing protein [Klebsiella pneumoniae]EKL8590095.1 lytic transglycosylase domain-containing protein [Klebsiella pneumoniae]EKV6040171.1 lytic transglycosylase domain-containing protein [Klebsiella pneumoniae]EKW4087878.1 lytic transglycosylase domain-containing protein [Kl